MKDTQINPDGLRVIKTARTQAAINEAVKQGYWPLVKQVIPSPEIKSKYAVYQNRKTGEVFVTHDYRLQAPNSDYEKIIGFTDYYPYYFEQPYAAYLIPTDLATGERVFIEDLIEDTVGSKWNQGDAYRLKDCEAIWDGAEFQFALMSGQKESLIG